MNRCVERVTAISVFSVMLTVLMAVPVQAAPIVVATVTPAGPLFHYDYAVTFDPLDDEIAILTIVVRTGDPSLDATLVAPANFLANYDIGLGLLDFLPVISFPAAGTVSGFAFDSAFSAAPTTFQALTIFGGFLNGATTGPLSAPVAPEPATAILAVVGLGAVAARKARRQRSQLRVSINRR